MKMVILYTVVVAAIIMSVSSAYNNNNFSRRGFLNKAVTSALIGVRSVAQLKDNLAALNNLKFTKDELKKIDKNAKEGNINLWAPSSSH